MPKLKSLKFVALWDTNILDDNTGVICFTLIVSYSSTVVTEK